MQKAIGLILPGLEEVGIKEVKELINVDSEKLLPGKMYFSSKSLKELARLQQKYPKEYQQFQEFQMDPTIMMKLFEQLDAKIKMRLISILFTSIALSQKVNTNLSLTCFDS